MNVDLFIHTIILCYFLATLYIAVADVYLTSDHISNTSENGKYNSHFIINDTFRANQTDEEREWFMYMYAEPYYRIPPYLVGMVMGYVFYKTKGNLNLKWVRMDMYHRTSVFH